MTVVRENGNGNGRRPSAASRLSPHHLESEESLLGAMLLSVDAVGAAVENCTAEDFYRPMHGAIFDTVVALWMRGERADPVTVEANMRATAPSMNPGLGALLSLQVATPATTNAARYARIVANHATMRRLIGAGGEIAELGYSASPDDADAAVDQAEALVFDIGRHGQADSTAMGPEVMQETIGWLRTMADRGDAVTGVPTGFIDLDHMLGGLQPSNLVIVGARPAVGKTAFALNVAATAVDAGLPVLMFSLEMRRREIGARLISAEAQVDGNRIRNPAHLAEGEWQQASVAAARIAGGPIAINDDPYVTLMDVRAKARRVQARMNGQLALVIVDYIQLMNGRRSAENRQVEVSEISRGLKILARELEVPILALSQLSRSLELRADKRPVLADLRESGSLEQDSDVVLFIHRPEKYSDEIAYKGLAEIIVAKQRNGPTGVVRLAYLDRFTRFRNMAKAT